MNELTEDKKNSFEIKIKRCIESYKDNPTQLSLLAVQSSSYLASNQTRARELAEQGILKRFLGSVTGSNQKLMANIQEDQAEAVWVIQKSLEILVRQQKLSCELDYYILEKLNNLREESFKEIVNIREDLLEFLSKTKKKFDRYERTQNNLVWSETVLREKVFEGKTYKQISMPKKIICLINKFHCNTIYSWSNKDEDILKSIMEDIGLRPNKKISPKDIFKVFKNNEKAAERLLENTDIVLSTIDENPDIPYISCLKNLANVSLDNKKTGSVEQYFESLSGRKLTTKKEAFNLILEFVEELQICRILKQIEEQYDSCIDTKSPVMSEFFKELTKQGIKYSEIQRKKIISQVSAKLSYEPKIGFLGRTGAGKSSLCNALFGQKICSIDHIKACTREPQEEILKIGSKGVKLIDLPGVGESEKRDEEYKKLYKKLIPELDLILWIIKADDRAFSIEENFNENLIKPNLEKTSFLVVINQADKMSGGWDEKKKQPGQEQLNNLELKRLQVANVFGVPNSKVIFVSAEKSYNLVNLVDEMVYALPSDQKYNVAKAIDENFSFPGEFGAPNLSNNISNFSLQEKASLLSNKARKEASKGFLETIDLVAETCIPGYKVVKDVGKKIISKISSWFK